MIAQRTRPRIYLAGPDVFRRNAEARGLELKALARKHGLDALWPLDGTFQPKRVEGGEIDWRALASDIFHANLEKLQRADAVAANIEPFRGPGLDGGTAFEIGWAHARGLPVFAYTNDARPYAHRLVPPHRTPPPTGEAFHSEKDGLQVENFGLEDNLMIAIGINSLHSAPSGAFQAAAAHFNLSAR